MILLFAINSPLAKCKRGFLTFNSREANHYYSCFEERRLETGERWVE